MPAGDSLQFPQIIDQDFNLFVRQHNFLANDRGHEAFPWFGLASPVAEITGVDVLHVRVIRGPDGGRVLQPFADPVLAVPVPHTLQSGAHGSEYCSGVAHFVAQDAMFFLEQHLTRISEQS